MQSAVSASASKILFAVIAVLSVAGMIVSGISLQRHYAKSETQFCEFGEKFNCDIVNRSEYSSVVGIPVAAIGLAGYGFLFALSTFFSRTPGNSESPADCVDRGAGFRVAAYLHRRLRSHDLVHSVSHFAGADFSDQRVRGCGED
jgi:hypothetical protein